MFYTLITHGFFDESESVHWVLHVFTVCIINCNNVTFIESYSNLKDLVANWKTISC